MDTTPTTENHWLLDGSAESATGTSIVTLTAALKLARHGTSVIPVRSKVPLVKWEAFQHRIASHDEITAWWDAYPDAGLGIVTGAVSNLVVLDIDGEVGNASEWVDANGVTPTVAVQTPSGGLHLYYTHPGVVTPNAARFTWIGGLPADIRGDGGYVVAPPSVGYQKLPHWRLMARWVRPGETKQHVATSLADIDLDRGVEDIFAPVHEGGRNHAAARVAGYLLKTCTDQQAAWVQLTQWNRHNVPPLAERELRTTFESIARREATQDRSLVVGIPDSRTPSLDILDGTAWADAIEFAPERDGLVLETLPLSASYKGFCPGDLALLAARPGTGKSTLVWGMAWELAIEQGVPTCLFSGEMSPADVARWMTHFRTGLSYITPDDWRETLALLRQSPIAIVNRGIFTPSMVAEALAQRVYRFVIIDHIQRMRLAKSESRNHELEQCAAELKGLAMQYQTTVFALCQLNRLADNVEHPTIAHLRDSGGLEQEADTVLGLSHVGDRLKADPLKATIRLATLKSRHGPENMEQIAWFHKATKRFEWLQQGPDWRNVQ